MTNAVVLNNEEHQNLKVDTRYAPEYGDSVNRVPVFSTEFTDIQKEYPILFHRDPDGGQLQAHAILGFDRDENLFLDQGDWEGRYVPGVLARGPFLIGFQRKEQSANAHKEPVVHIDMDNRRVGVDEGESLFLPSGEHSPYLEKTMRILKVIHQGIAFDKTFFLILEEMELLEPVNIEVTISNIQQYSFHDYYTVNEDKLANMEAEHLEKLHKIGVLRLLFFAQSSLGNFQRLIDLKNQKSAMVS